jgi:hypothetical protein
LATHGERIILRFEISLRKLLGPMKRAAMLALYIARIKDMSGDNRRKRAVVNAWPVESRHRSMVLN